MLRRFIIVAGVAAVSATAAGAPLPTSTPGRIAGSKHDIRVQYDAQNQNGEICIYCHTPHNAVMAIPLWNRLNPSASLFTLYNSPTLTSSARRSVLSARSISLFCMSCHDGVTGLGTLHNYNPLPEGRRAANASAPPLALHDPENAQLGFDLTNTHPVGFSYPLAWGEDKGLNSPPVVMKIFEDNKASYQTTAQYFLYGDEKDQFECSSCHRVHDPGTSGNFLRIENAGSRLCFACHRK